MAKANYSTDALAGMGWITSRRPAAIVVSLRLNLNETIRTIGAVGATPHGFLLLSSVGFFRLALFVEWPKSLPSTSHKEDNVSR
jgi:hypothetical protein